MTVPEQDRGLVLVSVQQVATKNLELLMMTKMTPIRFVPARPLAVAIGLCAASCTVALLVGCQATGSSDRGPAVHTPAAGRSPTEVAPNRGPSQTASGAAGLVRAPAVIDAKIARKSTSKGKAQPKNPSGLAMERFRHRLDEDGVIPPNALMIAKAEADQMPALVPEPGILRDGGIWSWEWLGPGNVGGRIRALVIDPIQTDMMWIGSAAGGIWKTIDRGASWRPVDDFMASLSVNTMVMDPADPTILYAGTGEGFTNGDALPGAGVFKSTDGGDTWSQLAATIPTNADPTTDNWGYVNRLAIRPDDGDVLLAATNSGVWRTSDGGQSWVQVTFTIALDVRFNPNDGTRAVIGRNNGTIWFSSDGGSTWNQSTLTGTPAATTVRVASSSDADINNDIIEVSSTAAFTGGTLPDTIQIGTGANQETATIVQVLDGDSLSVSDLANGHAVNEQVFSLPRRRVELAYSASTRSSIYASMDVGNGTIWKSTDDGANFNVVSDGRNDYFIGAGWYDNVIWVAPDDDTLVVVGGLDLWRSTDGGISISPISDWRTYHLGSSAHADHHIIVSHPNYGASNKTVFFGNDGGIQRTTNVETVSPYLGWTNLANGLGITQFYGGAAAPDGSVIVGGTQDNDKLRYRPADGTGGWYQATTGDGGAAAVDHNDPATLYGEYTNLEIRKSTDGGNSYFPAVNGLSDAGDSTNAQFIAPFSMDPVDPDHLVGGGSKIWRTTDAAANWVSIRGNFTGNPIPLCSAIDIDDGNSNRIWVGYDNGRVSHTTTSVTNWTDVDNNGPSSLPNRVVTDIAINPFDGDDVFVTFGGYTTDSVWFTADNGLTWQQRTGTAPTSLPSVQVNTVRFHPANPNWVYVGTDVGVFVSEDKGLTWNQTPRFGIGHDGPVNTEVSELFWQGAEYLIAATHGRGMYRVRALSVVFVDAAATGYQDGSQQDPYDTVQEALDAAGHGTAITIKAGNYDEGNTIFHKRGTIAATNGPVRIH